MTRKLLAADDVKSAILSKCDEIMNRVLTDDALPIGVTQAMRREVHTMKHCVEIIDAIPAAEGEGKPQLDAEGIDAKFWEVVIRRYGVNDICARAFRDYLQEALKLYDADLAAGNHNP